MIGLVLPALLLASPVGSDACAQMREGQAPVLAAPIHAAPVAPPDIAPVFARAYERAGRPRILLFWNQSLSEAIASATMSQEIVRQSSASSRNALDKSTAGPAGTAKISDSDNKDDSTRVTTRTSGYVGEPHPKAALSERNAAALEETFVSEMRRGGVRFVDKALAVRTTAAKRHRGGADPRLVETDALLADADLLMEIVFVADKDAPMGYAFDVRVKDVKAGTQIASTITRASPPRIPGTPAGWTTGENGYEHHAAGPPPKPGVTDVGQALARDVMSSLQPELRSAER